MSKMRRCIIPAILAAMALTALTACGGKSESADATTAETTTEAAKPQRLLRKRLPRQKLPVKTVSI